MRRLLGPRNFLHLDTQTLDAGDDATVVMSGCEMFRIVCTSVASGATLLYRGIDEVAGADGGDPADTDALSAGDCDILDGTRAESGWIDAQVSAVRLEAVTDSVTVKVQWTSRFLPSRS